MRGEECGGKQTPVSVTVLNGALRDGVAAIKAGTLFSTASQVPTTAGKRAAEAANDYFNGKTLPPQIIIPVDLINKDNIDKWADLCSF